MKYEKGKAFTECCRPNPKTSKISNKEFSDNWDRIFGKKGEKKNDESKEECTTKKPSETP
jgi:hypothetical protein